MWRTARQEPTQNDHHQNSRCELRMEAQGTEGTKQGGRREVLVLARRLAVPDPPCPLPASCLLEAQMTTDPVVRQWRPISLMLSSDEKDAHLRQRQARLPRQDTKPTLRR